MALTRESPRLPRTSSEGLEADRASPRTPPALRRPRDRGAAATRLARSARLARFGAVALAAVVAGCEPYVEGNGVFDEDDRTPATVFRGVHLEDGVEATVTSGAVQTVTVSGDANLVPYILTEIVEEAGFGPVLHVRIEVPGGWSSTIPPRADVQLAELRYVFASGGSHVSATQVATLVLSVDARDRGEVLIAGPGGGRIEVLASSAAVDAGSYPVSEGAEVDLSSGARVELDSDGPVTGTVRGGCTLDNLLGAGSCSGVFVPAGETATLQCNPAP